ncbi:MAG TPA: Gfo/Idh/MocA family oxidoreductase [Bryobacteraceae bacterium]
MKRTLAVLFLASSLVQAADTLEVFGHKWSVPDAKDWKIDTEDGSQVLHLVTGREPLPGPRRPFQFAIADTPPFSKVTIEADARPLKRSLIVVFGYRDPAHFNYVHFSTDTATKQPVHNGVFHVFGGERVRISGLEGPAAFPEINRWHHIRVVWDGTTGNVQGEVDGQPVPSLHAVDMSIHEGKIGLGSFNETADFKNVSITTGLRLGVVGTDTSHVVAFTNSLNNGKVSGANIVVAYKGGSPEIEESRGRIDKFSAELRDKFGVRFVDKISDMCGSVDGILIESVDARTHLASAKEAVGCHKPLFIDKPLAASLADAREIARVTAAAHVPWFSASSLRFSSIQSLKQEPVKGAIVWGPGPTEPHQPLELSWYGIHAAEMLYTLLGTGCAEVTQTASEAADVVTCRWHDGRLGTMRVDRPYSKFGAVVFRDKNRVEAQPDIPVDYVPLVRQIVDFVASGKPPVPNNETLEMFAFMDAAQRSKKSGGKAVTVDQSKGY